MWDIEYTNDFGWSLKTIKVWLDMSGSALRLRIFVRK